MASSPVVVALVAAVTVLAVVGIWLMAVYNGLVTRRVRVQNAFSQIDVQLRRRHDLVPNLVASVKGYMQHERATLEAVTSARAAAVTAQARKLGITTPISEYPAMALGTSPTTLLEMTQA